MRVSNVCNRTRPELLLWLLPLMLISLFGCGGPSDRPGSSSGDLPELTDELIRERINGVRVGDIREENNDASEPISWRFFQEEPKEITVVEKQVDGTRATVVLDIKTQSTPRAREPRYLAGQIRTEWELQSGMVLRQWEVVGAENISMKYRNLPKPPPQNPER